MDHREPEPAASRRFARMVPPEAKANVPRLLAGAAVGLVVVLLFGFGVDWVGRQPDYQIPFRDITLNPPAPRWFRGGSTAFLEQVQKNVKGRSDTVPILAGDLKPLADRFRLFPWVRSVPRVHVHPGQIVVELEYRTPVAEKGGWLIDADGILLPPEPVDRTAIELLLVEHLKLPYDPQPGKAWQVYDEAHQTAREDSRAAAAGRLAAFLLAAPRDGGQPPRVKAVLVGEDEHKLFVQFEPVTRVSWGSAPGNETRDEPSATEKWQLVREWFREHPEPLPRDEFLVPSGKKLIIQHEADTASRGPVGQGSGGSAESMSRYR